MSLKVGRSRIDKHHDSVLVIAPITSARVDFKLCCAELEKKSGNEDG